MATPAKRAKRKDIGQLTLMESFYKRAGEDYEEQGGCMNVLRPTGVLHAVY